ncbi:hypothetical protein EH223_11325 [candidate division KSB1 bacterium]|nr:hypothetical protein [candidate division KSB1 bacterium]RQW02953.1 MAG: hypothetical protein EH223_11325 [candidate division KSB1 bacterium]
MRLVLDTCICIDLNESDCLYTLKSLPYKVCISSVLANELENPSLEKMVNAGCTVLKPPFEHMLRLDELIIKYRKTSAGDLTSMLTAQAYGAILVTGDAELRKAAETENVTVHGLLWLLDEMVDNNVLKPREAAKYLKIMLSRDRRLPLNECEQRIKKWTKSNE